MDVDSTQLVARFRVRKLSNRIRLGRTTTAPFTLAHARQMDVLLTRNGIPITAAQALIDEWNRADQGQFRYALDLPDTPVAPR